MTKSNFIIAGLSIAILLVFYLLFQACYPSSSAIQSSGSLPLPLDTVPSSIVNNANDTSTNSFVASDSLEPSNLYKKTLSFTNATITLVSNGLNDNNQPFFQLPTATTPYTLEKFLADNNKPNWIQTLHQTSDNHIVYPEPSSAVAFSLINRQQYGSLLNNDSTKQPSYGTLSKSCSFGEDISLAGVLWNRLICKETFKDGEYQSITINSTCLTSIPNKESFLRVSYVLQNGDADACEFLKSLNLSAVVIE